MVMKIDQDRIDSGDLTRDEKIYLQQRGKLPSHIMPILRDSEGRLQPEDSDGPPDIMYLLDQIPFEIIEAAYNRRKEAQELELQKNTPTIEDKGGIVDRYDDETDGEDEDDTVDYQTMTNKELRAALADRGLTVEGKKDDFIARLERSDRGEPEPEDILTL